MAADPLTKAIPRVLKQINRQEMKCIIPPVPEGSESGFEGMHVHDGWQIQISLKNEFLILFNEGPVVVNAKQFLLIRPSLPHGTLLFSKKYPRSKVELVQVYFTSGRCKVRYKGLRSNFQRYLLAEEYLALSHSMGVAPYVAAEQMVHAHENQMPEIAMHTHNAWLKILFCSLATVISRETPRDRTREEIVVRETMDYIHDNYHSPDLKTKTVAEAMGLSSSTLSHIFRKTTGQSIWHTVMDIRFDHAQRLLQEDRYTIKEVAFLTGWQNPLYFSTAFKKHFGYSPSDLPDVSDKIAAATRRLADDRKTLEEIVYELGFENVDHFSKVFERHEGMSPAEYRRKRLNMDA